MICQSRFSTSSIFSLFLILIFPGMTSAQEKSQIKEPPIPVVMGSNSGNKQIPDEESITLSVSDFNHVMEREDSLRRVFSEQTSRLQRTTDNKSMTIYGLLFVLVLSNLLTATVARKRNLAGKP